MNQQAPKFAFSLQQHKTSRPSKTPVDKLSLATHIIGDYFPHCEGMILMTADLLDPFPLNKLGFVRTSSPVEKHANTFTTHSLQKSNEKGSIVIASLADDQSFLGNPELKGHQLIARDDFEDKVNDIFEPTPFRNDMPLQVSPYSRETFLPTEDPNPQMVQSESYLFDTSELDAETTSSIGPKLSSKRKQRAIPLQRKRAKYSKTDLQETISDVSHKTEEKTAHKPHQEDRWNEFFLALCRFKQEHGDTHVPHTYPQDPSLARWAKRQRYQYKLQVENKSNTMTSDRLQKLESIGFVWDPQSTAWETHCAELALYLKEHGDCNVPCRYARNRQLGMWVKRQRRQYKLYKRGRSSRLSPERFHILNNMGFVWEVRGESTK